MKKIGRTSFTAEGYEKFVSLTKEEQIKQISDGLSPKDPEQAEKLLTRIPHGTGVSTGNDKQASESPADDTGRNEENNTKGSKSTGGKSKGV